MKWIVDRIEENIAVLECGDEVFNLNKSFLPTDVKEGDVISLKVDKEQKDALIKTAEDKMKKLFKG